LWDEQRVSSTRASRARSQRARSGNAAFCLRHGLAIADIELMARVPGAIGHDL
jgi:hypothetical protein